MLIMEKNPSDVEDVVHDAMVSLIEHLDIIDFEDEVKVKNFCGVVARNKAIDHCRKAGNRNIHIEDLVVEPVSENDDPVAVVVSHDTYSAVLKAINDLDDTFRDVCLLKYVNELKEREIAKVLNVPIKTVNSRINRGKQILRDVLRKEKHLV